MPSERIQRQVDRLLDEAEAALAANEWAVVRDRAHDVLALDDENEDAKSFLTAADKRLAQAGSAREQPTRPSGMPAPTIPAPLPASFVSGRYRILRLLGQGGRKRVYLARDERLGREVAFAVVPGDALTLAERERFLREAQAMARLGSSPHLVSIFDIGEDGDDLFTVQEYMAGGDVAQLVAEAGETRLPIARTLAIAKDVCRALSAIHQAGIIHRDLKPANVFLAADGSARVGDFGLAADTGADRLTQHGTMLGTATYMPPEQALGGEVTAQSDLYALGVMLYEMVTGRPPFGGDDPVAVISQHINTPPVAPSWHTERCPPDLEAVILRLLAKDPKDRPASAREVREVLARVDPKAAGVRHTGSAANPLDRLARGVFVGREQELVRLRAAFDEAFAGHGKLVMLVGEPGIGKTRTAQELETYARMRGADVLWGRNHESSGAPPYWPWIQVGRQWSAGVDPAAVAVGMTSSGWELVRLFPELRQNPEFVEPQVPLELAASQFRLFDAFTSFIRNMTRDRAVVVTLDDLHWADKPTLLLLEHVAREIARMRVLILCNYRDTDLARTHPLSEALAELGHDPGFERIVLRGLSRKEVGSYIAGVAGREPVAAVVDRIHEETEGNPFFLAEVVNLLAQEESLLTSSVSDLRIPDGVREALGRRLDRVSKEANGLLQLAAVVGREFTFEALRPLDGGGAADEGGEADEALLRRLEEGLEARVIEEMAQPGRYRFTHALMQETLLSELSTTRRVRLHGRVGEVLERTWGGRAAEHAAELASHFAESATLTPAHAEKACRFARLAGEVAERQSAWAEAVRWYEAALADEGDADPDLLSALARCHALHLGPWQLESVSILGRALEGYRRREDRAGLAGAVAAFPIMVSDAARLLPLMVEAVEAATSEGLADRVRLDLMLKLYLSADWLAEGKDTGDGQLRELAEELLRLAVTPGIAGGRAVEQFVAGLQAKNEILPEAAAVHGLDAGAEFEKLGAVEVAQWSYMISDVAGQCVGDLELAERAGAALERVSRKYRLPLGLVFASLCALSRALLRWQPEVLFEAAARTDTVIPPTHAAAVHRLRGEKERAIELTPAPPRTGDETRPALAVQGHAGRATYYFMRDKLEDARREFESWVAVWRAGGGNAAERAQAVAGVSPCIDRLGDDAFWREVYDEIKTWKNWTGYASGVGLDPIRGRLALRFGLVDDAEEAFSDGLAWSERYACPIEAGRNLQGLASIAERRGNTPAALSFLDRAAAYYAPRGIKPLLDEVMAAKLRLQGAASKDVRASIDVLATSVGAERPDLAPRAAPNGTVTILFSDIEGSTALNVELGDDRWMEVLADHNRRIRRCIAAHRGFEVKTEGDAFMVAFQSARDALRCAAAIQRAFVTRNETTERLIRVRIGLHTGEPVKQGDDFYGTHVVMASRIAAQAMGGEILVSALLRELVAASGEFKLDEGRELDLKGLPGTHRVYAVLA